jgi:hypothetical protein
MPVLSRGYTDEGNGVIIEWYANLCHRRSTTYRLDIPTLTETPGYVLKYQEDIDNADADLLETILHAVRR